MDFQEYIECGVRTRGTFDGREEFALLDMVDARVTGHLYAFQEQAAPGPVTGANRHRMTLVPCVAEVSPIACQLAQLAWSGAIADDPDDPLRCRRIIAAARAEYLRMVVGCERPYDLYTPGVDLLQCDDAAASRLIRLVQRNYPSNDHVVSRYLALGYDRQDALQNAVDLCDWVYGYGGGPQLTAITAMMEAEGPCAKPSASSLFYALALAWVDESAVSECYQAELLAHAGVAMTVAERLASGEWWERTTSANGQVGAN